jgi:hypothetical protein
VVEELNPGAVNRFPGAREAIKRNFEQQGKLGLSAQELVELLDHNLDKIAVSMIHRNADDAKILRLLQGGQTVLAHVDGNHWVRITGVFKEGNVTWVRIQDSARGNYEQLLTSLWSRLSPFGAESQIIGVRPIVK